MIFSNLLVFHSNKVEYYFIYLYFPYNLLGKIIVLHKIFNSQQFVDYEIFIMDYNLSKFICQVSYVQ